MMDRYIMDRLMDGQTDKQTDKSIDEVYSSKVYTYFLQLDLLNLTSS